MMKKKNIRDFLSTNYTNLHNNDVAHHYRIRNFWRNVAGSNNSFAFFSTQMTQIKNKSDAGVVTCQVFFFIFHNILEYLSYNINIDFQFVLICRFK
jgi:hypothetical protein